MIQKLRKTKPNIICLGSYPMIIQSILDFDYLSGKKNPSILGIIGSGRKLDRYFFGPKETLLPVFPTPKQIPITLKKLINYFINLNSGRRALSTTLQALDSLPEILAGTIFAENMPEKHSLELIKKTKKIIIGPASVGLIIPNKLKLGAIGGTQTNQLVSSHLFEKGQTAVFSASGGMTNELIQILTQSGNRISFSLSFGGSRFPIFSPQQAFIMAENDPETKNIIYFGELGGYDEYKIANLIKTKKVTKKIIAYVAGTISEMFKTPPQFGHAKAIANNPKESALEKRAILKASGAIVPRNFSQFVKIIKDLKKPQTKIMKTPISLTKNISQRKKTLFISDLPHKKVKKMAEKHSLAYVVISLLLAKEITSKELENFIDLVLKLLVDHGPYVSGAVNTMIASRANKDLVSSLCSGLLTIGSRFGGAINQSAKNWLLAVEQDIKPEKFVEQFAQQKKYIPGIGHKKYSLNNPDYRVTKILKFSSNLKKAQYTKMARQIEKITLNKKNNLILNVDGAIAAVLLDLLTEKENFTIPDLKKLIEIEFFNALFVLSRSIGFTARYLDQRRLDEGLFRLPEDEVSYL